MVLRKGSLVLDLSVLSATLLALVIGVNGRAQTAAPAKPVTRPGEFHFPTPAERAAINAASAVERNRELKLLGITEMQPPATAYDIGKPGNAN